MPAHGKAYPLSVIRDVGSRRRTLASKCKMRIRALMGASGPFGVAGRHPRCAAQWFSESHLACPNYRAHRHSRRSRSRYCPACRLHLRRPRPRQHRFLSAAANIKVTAGGVTTANFPHAARKFRRASTGSSPAPELLWVLIFGSMRISFAMLSTCFFTSARRDLRRS